MNPKKRRAARAPRILVTGGGGLLGHALLPLLKDALFATSADVDLRDRAQTEKLFARARPDKVVHLAAVVGGVKKNAASNAELLADNLLINANVLDAAHRAGVKTLVSMLSSCSYSFYPDRPSTEEDLHVGLPFSGNLGYGYSKRALHLQTRLLREQYGARYSTLTPATMYGPHDNWDLESGHVVASLIRKCFLAKSRRGPLSVWGTGKAVRQFIFVDDVARLIQRLIEDDGAPEDMIVAPDQGVTIRALAEAVARATGFTGPIIFDASQPEGQRTRVLRSDRFAQKFPNWPFTALDAGLKATAEWFQRNVNR